MKYLYKTLFLCYIRVQGVIGEARIAHAMQARVGHESGGVQTTAKI